MDAMACYKYLAEVLWQLWEKSRFADVEKIPEDEEQDEEPESTTLRAAFAKTLTMADETETTSALQRALNTFAQLATGNHFAEESSTRMNGTMSAKTHHAFTAPKGSPWENAVQGVVDSVNVMANRATDIQEHPHAAPSGATARPPSTHFSPPTLATTTVRQDLISAVQEAVFRAMQDQLSYNEITMPEIHPRKLKGRRSFPAVLPFREWLARSWRSPSESAPTALPFLTQSNEEPYIPAMAGPERVPPSTRTTARTQSNEIPKERMMTIHPLLIPSEDRLIPAYRLASLYFTAVLDPRDIPEFKAEFIYAEGRRSSILLTFKSVHDSERLKELWDSADRENTRAPELAQVSMYRGNTSVKPTDTSVREEAFDELSSFRLTPSAVP